MESTSTKKPAPVLKQNVPGPDDRGINQFSQIHVPTNCGDCATNCALKQSGCVRDVAEWLSTRGVRVDPDGAKKIGAEASACLRQVQVEATRQNLMAQEEAKLRAIVDMTTRQVLKVLDVRLGQANGHANRAPPKPVDLVEHSAPGPSHAPPPAHAKPAPILIEVPSGNGTAQVAEQHANGHLNGHVAKVQAKTAYVSEQDHRIEDEALAEVEAGTAFTLCLVPRVNKARIPEWEERAKRWFSTPPFAGLIGIVSKLHSEGSDIVRIAAYYRGPPVREAEGILRTLRTADKATSAEGKGAAE